MEETMAALEQKYDSAINLAKQSGVNLTQVSEANGKLVVAGTAPYQMQKDEFFDELKKQAGWQNEVEANIKVGNMDYYGEYTVQPGDTLSKIAGRYLGDPAKYPMIVDANAGTITDPDKIDAGQTIKLPLAAALH
jgi:nucleoid-associated protein YgaU